MDISNFEMLQGLAGVISAFLIMYAIINNM